MPEEISIAIETSCRAGSLAVGCEGELWETLDFDSSRGHATQLVSRLEGLLNGHGLFAGDVRRAYVSVGPGSYTGLRVGITVVRTLAQAVEALRCVAVPTAWAVADNARDLAWQDLAVVMDAGEGNVYAQWFTRAGDGVRPAGEARVQPAGEFLASAPRPALLTGEGLAYHDLARPDVSLADPALYLPTAEGVWRVGCTLTEAGRFTEYHHLLPIYTRKPSALRLWEQRHGK